MNFNTYISVVQKSLKNTRIALFLVVFFPMGAWAQEAIIPNYFDAQERVPIGDARQIDRIRFLTTVDFPPFSFLDENGKLTGFHVDLARNICAALKVLERCQIQALEWNDLNEALEKRQGDAIIAGIAISEKSREKLLFSRSYLELPARFIATKENTVDPHELSTESQISVGVLKGTAHEAMLKNWFQSVKTQSFSTQKELYDSLKSQQVSALFGDGLQFSFWLSSAEAANCCQFVGGPYLSQKYLGEGLAIAVSQNNSELLKNLNYGLSLLGKSGKFSELYLRYFPNGIY